MSKLHFLNVMSCQNYKGTKSPDFSDAASANERLCAGTSPISPETEQGIQDLDQVWDINQCVSVFREVLYGGEPRQLDKVALARLQQEMDGLFALYIKVYKTLSQPAVSHFLDKLVQTCRELPGVCDVFLDRYCQNCDRGTVANDAFLTTLCGCRVPEPPDYGVEPICDLMCSYVDTIRPLDPNSTGGQADECQSTICVIDGISVNSLESRIGEIRFSQLCSNCSSEKGNCKCIVVLDDVPPGIQIDQNCATADCYQTDPQDSTRLNLVTCPSDTRNQGEISSFTIVIGIIIVIVVVVALIILFSRKKD